MSQNRLSRKHLKWATLVYFLGLSAALAFLIYELMIGGHRVIEDGPKIPAVDETILKWALALLLGIHLANIILGAVTKTLPEVYDNVCSLVLDEGSEGATQDRTNKLGEFRYITKHQDNYETIDTQYLVGPKDDLSGVAIERHGHSHYKKLIKRHNGIDVDQIPAAGRVIRSPCMRTIFADEGLTATHPKEVALMLEAQSKYRQVEPKLRNLQGTGDGTFAIPLEIRKTLEDIAVLIDEARAGFIDVGSGMRVSEKLAERLRRLALGLRRLSASSGPTPRLDLELFHKRFVHATLSAIDWARNGFR